MAYVLIHVSFLYGLVPPSPTHDVTGLPQTLFLLFRINNMTLFIHAFSRYVKILCFYLFGRTPSRRGAQFHTDRWSKFVLSSHPNLIGNQNDVQHFTTYYTYIYIYILHIWYCTYLWQHLELEVKP